MGGNLGSWAKHPATQPTLAAELENLETPVFNPTGKFKADRIRYIKMKTTGKKGIGLNIPGGVMSRDFSEKADGTQRMVFFYRSLYDAIRVKQLASNSRFARPALDFMGG
jgi:hypothetical protein